jgi:hypothetical protein
MMNKLTNRQRVFVELYLTLWNATEAARQAGYSGRSANVTGPRLLVNASVQKAIEHRIAEKTATADEVLMRLTDHSRSSMADFINDFGTIDIDKARAAGKMHLIKKLKQHTTRISKTDGEDVEYHDIEIELYDAQAATVQLGRARGVFNADQTNAPQVTVTNQLAIVGVTSVDYRSAIADLAPGPVADLPAPGADEVLSDGPALG